MLVDQKESVAKVWCPKNIGIALLSKFYHCIVPVQQSILGIPIHPQQPKPGFPNLMQIVQLLGCYDYCFDLPWSLN